MVSQSYRSVLEAEILRDYRLPRSASLCSSRHLEATRSKACTTKAEDHGAGAAPERPTSPRKLGKKASSRRLVAKLIEVPLKVEKNSIDAPKERGGIDLRRIGSTRLLTAAKATKQKPVKPPRDTPPSGAAAEIRVEKKKEGKDDPRGTSLRRRASSKRLLESKPSTRKVANIADMEVKKEVEKVETVAQEIAFVPPRAVRAPSSTVASIFYGSGRTKPSAAISRSVTFVEDEQVTRVEFAYDQIEYQDFPEVPSYEHLEHDEYYEAMAEMVAELNGRAADSSRRSSHRNAEFTVCSAVEVVVSTEEEFTVCFAAEPSPCGGDGNGSTTEAANAKAVPNTNSIAITASNSHPDAQPDVGGDSSTTSDTLPLSQDDESYLPDQFRASPRPTHGGLTDSPSKVSPLEAVIPRTVIYQSPETKKRRRSALSVMKRTLKIVSL